MKNAVLACVACMGGLMALSGVSAQDEPAWASTIPIEAIIEEVAKTTGKEFIVDPRVRAEVMMVRKDMSDLTYADLLAILQVHGFAAVEGDRFIKIVPDAGMRQLPSPVVSANEQFDDSAQITKVIRVRSTPAAQLVPVLRPLMPQQAHLSASVCTNDLIIVDSAANVRRIEEIVASLDNGKPYKPSCPEPIAASDAPRK